MSTRSCLANIIDNKRKTWTIIRQRNRFVNLVYMRQYFCLTNELPCTWVNTRARGEQEMLLTRFRQIKAVSASYAYTFYSNIRKHGRSSSDSQFHQSPIRCDKNVSIDKILVLGWLSFFLKFDLTPGLIPLHRCGR